MNKRCVALADEQYRESIRLLREGFVLEGKTIKPNPRIAAIEVLQASLGLRLGDVLQLRMGSFVKDNGRWRLDIKEQKTGKVRGFTVAVEIYPIPSWSMWSVLCQFLVVVIVLRRPYCVTPLLLLVS